jgi:hypothetical protein
MEPIMADMDDEEEEDVRYLKISYKNRSKPFKLSSQLKLCLLYGSVT